MIDEKEKKRNLEEKKSFRIVVRLTSYVYLQSRAIEKPFLDNILPFVSLWPNTLPIPAFATEIVSTSHYRSMPSPNLMKHSSVTE